MATPDPTSQSVRRAFAGARRRALQSQGEITIEQIWANQVTMRNVGGRNLRDFEASIAAKGVTPKEVFLVVLGPNGDPGDNDVAQWCAERSIAVHGVRYDGDAIAAWLTAERNAGRDLRKQIRQIGNLWSEYVWRELPDNATVTDSQARLKVKWIDGAWQDM